MAVAVGAVVALLLASVAHCADNILQTPVLDITLPGAPPGPCLTQARMIADSLSNNTLWASQMWDATARGTSGILGGSTWHVGSFDECVTVEGPFQTQYCFVHVQIKVDSATAANSSTYNFIKNTINIDRLMRRDVHHFGVCVPATCTISDLKQAFDAQLMQANTSSRYNITLQQDMCTVIKSKPFSINEILFGVFVGLLLLLSVLGSCGYSGPGGKVLAYFSVIENTKGLMKVSKSEGNDPMAILHGIKVAMMFMVVFGHKLLLVADGFVYDYATVVEDKFTTFTQLLMGSYLDMLVDAFFFISGVILTYLTCQKWNRKGWFPLALPLVGRIIRLAPAYYSLVWINATGLLSRLGNGPLWNKIMDEETVACQNYWWANVLFIQNYIPLENMCQVHTWYLGCDMQFFMLAFVLLPVMIRRPKLGITILVVVTAVASLITPIASYVHDQPPLMLFTPQLFTNRRNLDFFRYMYFPSHVRATVYLLGIAVGYFLHVKSSSKYVLTTGLSLVGLIVGLVCFFATGAISTIYYSGEAPSTLFSAFYAWFRRPLWVMGFAVLMITQRFSTPNVVSRALSCDVIVILSKLTYTMYIIHAPFMISHEAFTHRPAYYTIFWGIRELTGDYCYMLVFSVVIYVVLEMPAKRILGLLILRHASSNSSD